ncbi:MAG: hypothetical protein HLUCCO07_12710 [Rhodobacteraceae bacterium HLUCCO07]|nr:MAG: hypothetical protein HLUCCO07_12710 [Rhodobacteraceae bacterium HLUCCO07]
MKPLGDMRRHFWMVQKMARAQGLDLAGAMARGDLDQAEWAGIVKRCQSCDGAAHCARLLAGDGPGELPGYCCNREPFRILLADQVMGESA